MKTKPLRIFQILLAWVLLAAARDAFSLGADHPNDQPVVGLATWPKGLEQMVNATNRIHGFFVNQEDVFFYSGSAAQLTKFLGEFAKLEGVVETRLLLHDGAGEAKSPWAKEGRPCDWKLTACPKGWRNLATLSRQGTNSVEALQKAAKEPGYVVEVHFWTGGRIALDQVDVPKNIEVKRD
jgi:hypothetical protein